MGRYIDPVCRQCRRIGEKLFLKGERCYTPRCGVERRKRPPGDQIPRRRRPSDWAMQLRQKQKARFTYGVLERQFRKYFDMAREQAGVTGDNLIQILETRLDNVVYRLGWAESRKEARQVVTHGHIAINGRRARTPSAQIRVGDAIGWMERSKKSTLYEIVQHQARRRTPPTWLEMNSDALEGKVAREPERADMDIRIDDRLIVEFYSR